MATEQHQVPDGIHPQLRADCHYLGKLPSGPLLLHRNAALHWFVLVPDTELADVLDLPAGQSQQLMADCAGLSRYLKNTLGYGKVNFAGLGNQVPQMHLHVVGRRVGDACWPQPVWGNLPDGGDYSDEQLAECRRQLIAECGLRCE